ncbi:MAG: pyridoxal phosphate-dependent aminotransferase [Pseudomonadota bacterium]
MTAAEAWTVPQAPDSAEGHLRRQILTLDTDNIADLATKAGQLEDVITLWYGEGDVVTPPFIREAATRALDAGQTFYVPNMRGYGPLNEALSAYQTRIHGRPIAVERSTVTPGGMQALLIAMEMVCDAGDNVVYIEPQWPNIRRVIHLVGGEPRAVPLDIDGADLSLDLDRVFDACDEKTRAIFLSTPSNPSGWTATQAELQALLDFSRERGIWIVSDEVYNRLWFGEGLSAPSMREICEDEDLVLTINTFSKAWAMTGWRIGWLGHPVSCAARVAAMTQYINSGTAAFVQAGAAAALNEGEDFVASMRERCRAGRDAAYEALERINSVVLPAKPPGGMYAFFRIEGQDDAREACGMILEKARVGLAPGFMFGDASRAFLRMCVCREEAQVREASERIARALA